MSEKIVLITGGRDYANLQAVAATLAAERPDRVIHGGCPTGADYWAGRWAHLYRVAVSVYPADWQTYGRTAGPRRNKEMLHRLAQYAHEGCEVLVLAFPGGRDTANTVREARLRGLPVREVGS